MIIEVIMDTFDTFFSLYLLILIGVWELMLGKIHPFNVVKMLESLIHTCINTFRAEITEYTAGPAECN